MKKTRADYQAIEKHRNYMHKLILEEATFNHRAFPSGDIDEVFVVLLFNKLTIAFPNRVVVPQISHNFQINFTSAILELKKLMYDPEFGVWMSFSLHLGINDSFFFLFNYEEPIDILTEAYDDQVYRDELNQWTRSEENIPEWWRQKIDKK